MLAQAEAMRAAAREELEAQRIYTEAAMLKADAHDTLDQLKAQLEATESSDGAGQPPQSEAVASSAIAVKGGSEDYSVVIAQESNAGDATDAPVVSDDAAKASAGSRRVKSA